MEWHDQTQWYKILFVGDAGEYKKKKKKKITSVTEIETTKILWK